MIIQEAVNGESPAVGIATCSPLKPSPTCSLLRDYFRWKADGKSMTFSAPFFSGNFKSEIRFYEQKYFIQNNLKNGSL